MTLGKGRGPVKDFNQYVGKRTANMQHPTAPTTSNKFLKVSHPPNIFVELLKDVVFLLPESFCFVAMLTDELLAWLLALPTDFFPFVILLVRLIPRVKGVTKHL